MTCEQVLDRNHDHRQAFLKVMARSDIATESHNTTGSTRWKTS